MDISEKEIVDFEESAVDKNTRRSSILKPQRQSKSSEENLDFTTKASRRVSFASSNFIKPFATDPEKNTIWDLTYEEEINHTDSTKSSCEKNDLLNTTSVADNLTVESTINCYTSVRKPFTPLVSHEYISNKENIFEPSILIEKPNERRQIYTESESFCFKTGVYNVDMERQNKTMHFENSQQNMELTAVLPVASNIIVSKPIQKVQTNRSILKNKYRDQTIYYNAEEAEMEFTATLIPPNRGIKSMHMQKGVSNFEIYQNDMSEQINFNNSNKCFKPVSIKIDDYNIHSVREKTATFQFEGDFINSTLISNSTEIGKTQEYFEKQNTLCSSHNTLTMDFTSNVTSADVAGLQQLDEDTLNEQSDYVSMEITSNLGSEEIQDVESPRRQTVCFRPNNDCKEFIGVLPVCHLKKLQTNSTSNPLKDTKECLSDLTSNYLVDIKNEPQKNNSKSVESSNEPLKRKTINFQTDNDSMEFTSAFNSKVIIVENLKMQSNIFKPTVGIESIKDQTSKNAVSVLESQPSNKGTIHFQSDNFMQFTSDLPLTEILKSCHESTADWTTEANNTSKNAVGIPDPQASNRKTTHFHSDNSMEFTAVLPSTKIFINDHESKANLTTETNSSSKNDADIPDSQASNRRTIHFQSDNSMEFTGVLTSTKIFINDHESKANLTTETNNSSKNEADIPDSQASNRRTIHFQSDDSMEFTAVLPSTKISQNDHESKANLTTETNNTSKNLVNIPGLQASSRRTIQFQSDNSMEFTTVLPSTEIIKNDHKSKAHLITKTNNSSKEEVNIPDSQASNRRTIHFQSDDSMEFTAVLPSTKIFQNDHESKANLTTETNNTSKNLVNIPGLQASSRRTIQFQSDNSMEFTTVLPSTEIIKNDHKSTANLTTKTNNSSREEVNIPDSQASNRRTTDFRSKNTVVIPDSRASNSTTIHFQSGDSMEFTSDLPSTGIVKNDYKSKANLSTDTDNVSKNAVTMPDSHTANGTIHFRSDDSMEFTTVLPSTEIVRNDHKKAYVTADINNISKNTIGIPDSRASNRTIHFQSGDSMEFTSVLPPNEIVKDHHKTKANLITETNNTSKNAANIPDSQASNRRTIHFQSDDSMEFTAVLPTTEIVKRGRKSQATLSTDTNNASKNTVTIADSQPSNRRTIHFQSGDSMEFTAILPPTEILKDNQKSEGNLTIETNNTNKNAVSIVDRNQSNAAMEFTSVLPSNVFVKKEDEDNSKLNLALEISNARMNKKRVNLPDPQPSSSNITDFRTNDSMEYALVLPSNVITKNNDNSKVNLVTETSSTSKNKVNVPLREPRITSNFLPHSLDFTPIVSSKIVQNNPSSEQQSLQESKRDNPKTTFNDILKTSINLGLQLSNSTVFPGSDLLITNTTHNLSKIKEFGTKKKFPQDFPVSDAVASQTITKVQNIQQQENVNFLPVEEKEIIPLPCNEINDNIQRVEKQTNNVNNEINIDPIKGDFRSGDIPKTDLNLPENKFISNKVSCESFYEPMEVDSLKIENSFKDDLRSNIIDRSSNGINNIVETNQDIQEHNFKINGNYSIGNVYSKTYSDDNHKKQTVLNEIVNTNSVQNSFIISEAANPLETHDVKSVTQLDKNGQENFETLNYPADDILHSEPANNTNTSELQPIIETDHVVATTPSSSFLINFNTYSPCIEDTQQLIHATIPKPESFKLDSFDIIATAQMDKLKGSKDKCGITDTTPVIFEDSSILQESISCNEVENTRKSDANCENVSDSLYHCNNYTLRSQDILNKFKTDFFEIKTEEILKKRQAHAERMRKLREERTENLKHISELLEDILKVEVVDLEGMFREAEEEFENTDSKDETENEETKKLLNVSNILYEKVHAAARRSETIWKFDKSKTTDDHYHFTALSGTVKFIVHLHPELGIVYSVNAFEDTWMGSSSARLMVHYKNRCFLHKMKKESLLSALGPKFEILTLLDYVSMTVEEVSKFDEEFQELLDTYRKSHKLKLNSDFSISFEILSVDFKMWWVINVKMSFSNIGSQESVSATYKIGQKVCEDEIKRIAEKCTVGVKFLRSFIESIDEYKARIGKRVQLRTKGNNVVAFF